MTLRGPYGQRTTVTLDANGYLASVTDPNQATWRFAYSDKGLITTAADARDNISIYNYDREGRVVGNCNAVDASNTFVRTASETNMQVAKTDAVSNTTHYNLAYTRAGDVTRSIVAPNGAASRLTGILHTNGATPFNQLQYVLDAMGNRTQLSEGDGLASSTTGYVYDELNRLTQVSYPAIPGGPAASTVDYTLDAVGNRLSDGTTSYAYDAADRITNPGFTYTANSNLLSDGTADYEYDSANRLTRMTAY